MAKQRQSNIELCRLISILLVMVLHTTYQSLGVDVSLGIHLVEGFTLIGVNVFVMITGYFSATPKKISLLNLAFICFFWVVIKNMCLYKFGQPINYTNAFFITNSNWFIPSYIVLLLLAPILNLYCSKVEKKTLMGGVILLLFAEIWFDWVPPTPMVRIGAQSGYSVLSFVILYLLARYIRLYGLPEWFKKYSSLFYIASALLTGLMIHVFVVTGHEGAVGLPMAYTNPIVIFSSVAFLTMFERMSFHSKFINHIAKSTLACLLGHGAIFFLYTEQFKYIYNNYSGMQLVAYWVLAIALVFVVSIIIDQLRLLLWKPLNNWLIKYVKNNNLY